MTRQEKIEKLGSLRKTATQLKKDVDYYNALQLARFPLLVTEGGN